MTPVTGTRIFIAAMNFIAKNFGGVIGAALPPLLVCLALAAAMGREDVRDLIGGFRQPETESDLPSATYLVLLLMSVLAQMWLLTRVFRFRLAKEFPPVSGELSGTFWLLLYGIAIGLIFLLPLIGAALLAASLLHLAGADLQAMMSNPWVIAGLIGAILGFLVAFLYVTTRFSVALPAVAIGGRPGIFHTMWPLGRDVTWGLLGWSLLLALGISTVMGVFMVIGLASFLPVLMSAETPADIATALENHFGWAVAMLTFIQAPTLLYYVASSTVFAEAYAQLSQPKPGIAE